MPQVILSSSAQADLERLRDVWRQRIQTWSIVDTCARSKWWKQKPKPSPQALAWMLDEHTGHGNAVLVSVGTVAERRYGLARMLATQ